jgi:hypothetical protein
LPPLSGLSHIEYLLIEFSSAELFAPSRERVMVRGNETKISLQVGTELRIKNNGDIVIDNPELELLGDDRAADAVLIYRFDPNAGEHILRLLDPVADHRHAKAHRPND